MPAKIPAQAFPGVISCFVRCPFKPGIDASAGTSVRSQTSQA